MHFGSIYFKQWGEWLGAMQDVNPDNPSTAAGRVYNVLKGHYGEWVGGWELTTHAQTTAISTRISEIRAQLTADPDRRDQVEMKQEGDTSSIG